MNRALIIHVILICLVINANATIRRVGFTDIPPVANVDYTTFYAAHQAAVAGDTIYVFPGKSLGTSWPTIYSRIQVSKKLIIISRGFWLDTATAPKGNAGLQAIPGTGLLGTDIMTFLPSSDGSAIMGFDIQGGQLVVQANNITIKRNYNVLVNLDNVSASNLLVEGNYRIGFSGADNVANVWSNLAIRNNFIWYLYDMPLKSYSGVISNNTIAFDATLTAASNGGSSSMSNNNTGNSINNNILLQGGTWLFENNLIGTLINNNVSSNVGYDFSGAENTTFNYNVAIQASNFSNWPSPGTGNVVLTPGQVPLIFEAFPAIGTSSADGRYRLKVGSPALAGSSVRPTATVDAGMFGGTTPYKLGMIPPIPAIYNISSPQGNSPTGNTLQVNLSIRSNN